ncbi:hypothetical protein [Rhodothermus marinus]|uniref:hypothetical protein n=1 Tax=Rhodothermus marinus TaxID=29549 RepID=UPI0012BA4CBE|nr:hypothetical protein [Rhodothermus marinus]BBM70575.1 hypothetical protein RmaAA213_24210 [Rhodothermus marinus]BBM73561.1 hypothetical protein RmaAA338_24260 [Rhodothermus marinus]
MRVRWGHGLLILALWSACTGPRLLAPDDRFGHRYTGQAPDGRVTLSLAPPDSTRSYWHYPAPIDTVHVRPGPFRPDLSPTVQAVPVELLIKGNLPDACSELDSVAQERTGHLLHVQLWMRRPQRRRCRPVVRPFRFYLMLADSLAPGSYTLKLNGRVFTFEIRVPEE